MNLYLLRHAIASPLATRDGFADSKRQLTPEGRKKTRRVAGAMQALGLDFDVILSSPFLRARQTAEIVAKYLKSEDRLSLCNHLTPGGKPEALIREILRFDKPLEDLLLVGHEPYLSKLISLLISGDSFCQVTMKKSGLCKLTTGALLNGRCASLEWLLTPRQLTLLA